MAAKLIMVGGHPLWECLRGLFQVREKPFVLGGRLVHCWLRVGRVAPRRARRFLRIDAIPSRRTDGAASRVIYSSFKGCVKINPPVAGSPAQTSTPVDCQ